MCACGRLFPQKCCNCLLLFFLSLVADAVTTVDSAAGFDSSSSSSPREESDKQARSVKGGKEGEDHSRKERAIEKSPSKQRRRI